MSGIVGGNLGRGSGLIKAGAIDDNSVTLAKMAGLARGKLIYGDTSGDPAALAVGGADEVLTHDGTDFDWAAAGGFDVSSITGATNLAAIPDNTDELVLSDGGTLKRIDYINLAPFGSLGGSFTMGSQTDLTDSTWNKLLLDTTTFNRGLTFGSSTITIPSGGDGDYFCSVLVDFNTATYGGIGNAAHAIYKNGSGIEYTTYNTQKAVDDFQARNCHIQWTGVIPALNATDTIEVYVNCVMDGSVSSGNRNAEKTRITLFKMNNN